MMLRKSLYRPSCLVHTFGCQSMIVARSVWQTKCNLNENFSIQFLNFQTRAGARDRAEPMRRTKEKPGENRRELEKNWKMNVQMNVQIVWLNRLSSHVSHFISSLYQLTLSQPTLDRRSPQSVGIYFEHLLRALLLGFLLGFPEFFDE